MYTNAAVIAAMETQFYVHDQTFWDWIKGNQGQIDFGDWEGPVYRFSPDDGAPTQISPPAPITQ